MHGYPSRIHQRRESTTFQTAVSISLCVLSSRLLSDHVLTLEEWWYDSYNEGRDPLVPYVSIASCSSYWYPLNGSLICRAADVIYHSMRFWEKIRNGTLPITRSRGVFWDMHQYYCLFNTSRVPELPKDRLYRYFKTEAEGQLVTPDELHHVLSYIDQHSVEKLHCVASLTTEHRDTWAKLRASIIALSERNDHHIQIIEKSCFCVTLTDNVYETKSEQLHAALMGEAWMQWADKSLNIIVCKDGQVLLQGEHSNVDAIAIGHSVDDVTLRSRKTIWQPKNLVFDVPKLLEFDLGSHECAAIDIAGKNFNLLKQSFRVDVVRFEGYGNDLARKSNLYMDTVVQIALQLAFLKNSRQKSLCCAATLSETAFDMRRVCPPQLYELNLMMAISYTITRLCEESNNGSIMN
ncbi:hypothetical protein KIN20_005337 [Parelaphostrongylus tenuis]|uniref:Choline/carnitine acyltransferase domain-containing protein n=1 Tax=Parelaphostrongylus tenuis TaxID=148309 RepID=A0AAD5ML80_PARTN|nr:hypothetical protein KIN20_005337 [Parelaphostrongylus tenuis]